MKLFFNVESFDGKWYIVVAYDLFTVNQFRQRNYPSHPINNLTMTYYRIRADDSLVEQMPEAFHNSWPFIKYQFDKDLEDLIK